MRMACVACMMLLPLVVLAQEVPEMPPYHAREAENSPYLLSDAEGKFYVRATPAGKTGEDGTTRVYRVGADGNDELLTTYKWYARPRRVRLCGNPDTNEVAVVLHDPRSGLDIENVKNETVLRFFGGGTALMTYRVKDLEQMGIQVKRIAREHPFYRQDYVVQGCERIGESEYAFTLLTSGNKRVRFDVRTGKQRVHGTATGK